MKILRNIRYPAVVIPNGTRRASPSILRQVSALMNTPRSILAITLSLLMATPAGFAQAPAPATPLASPAPDKPLVPVASGHGVLANFTRPYRQPAIPDIGLANSSRIEQLLRAGKLYLSLPDAIALALENNLDIELARYGPQIAQADYLRAQGGGLLRGVPTAVRQGPSSALSQAGVSGGGQGAGSSSQSGAGDAGGVGGAVITQTGVAVPNLDPGFFFSSSLGHISRPQANTVTTGLTAIALGTKAWNAGYQQNFLTGTTMSFGWNNSYVSTNNAYNDLNPNTSANMQLQISQRVLQGFGIAVNDRNIRVAKNDLRLSDLVFKSQVMATVSAIVNLYWDLVSFNEDAKVRQKALEVAQKFYEDNKKQVAIGTLAPIEIVRAEARVAQAQQDLTNAETVLFQQETILKSALSRTGVASPAVAEARVIPLDSLTMPANDPVAPVQDLVDLALKTRPDVEQTRVNLENNRIAIAGSRSALQPSLDVQASFQNSALTGSINTLPFPPGRTPIVRLPNEYFIGGYGNALGQIFRRNFPDYSIGFQLNVPLRNRVAQSDYVRDRLTLRQQELSQQRQINDIRVTVHNALTALTQARARHQAAVKERQLQVQTLDAENKKYALGASTAFQVVQTQRDLAQAQASEVSALASYSRARVQLDMSTAQILDKYRVEIGEAVKGTVARAPSVIPAGR
jgi:outer membrane protein TolC